MKQKTISILIVVAILDLLFFGFFIALSAGHIPGVDHETRSWRSIGAGSVALITFFGILIAGHSQEGSAPWSEAVIRTAFAAAIVILYLVLVSTVAFYDVRSGDKQEQLQALTETMLQSFTTVVGIVIAFFFGSSALIEVSKRRDRQTTESEKKNEASER